MNLYLRIKKYFMLKAINRQIKKQIMMVKTQNQLKDCFEMLSIDNLFLPSLISHFPAKLILLNMLKHRRKIIKSLNN